MYLCVFVSIKNTSRRTKKKRTHHNCLYFSCMLQFGPFEIEKLWENGRKGKERKDRIKNFQIGTQ